MDKEAFTDYLIICHGTNSRQVQAIADEVELRLKRDHFSLPNNTEGYQQAEWVLLDYVDFVVHVFTEEARKFRDLERLWKSAKRITPDEIKTRRVTPRTGKPKKAAAPSLGGKRKTATAKGAGLRRAIKSATSPRAAARSASGKSASKPAGRSASSARRKSSAKPRRRK